MIIKCESCNAELEVPDSLADGQPVRCPYCHCRFIYAAHGHKETECGEGTRQSSAEQPPIDGSTELWATVLPFGRHILNSWVSAWKSMFDFGGRMARREYLEFIVFQLLGMAPLFHFLGKNSVVRDNLVSDNLVSALLASVLWIMLFTLISATVRRLHDMNRSGMWLLCLLVLIPIGFAAGTVRFWFLCLTLLVVIGLIRARDEGNAYLPLRSIRWPLVVLMLILSIRILSLIGAMCAGNASHKDWPSCRQYTSPDVLARFDSSIGVTKEGAFGFMWGEWPLSKEHKPPCKVKYRVADVWDLYSEVELYYGEKGLSSFTFYGYGGQEIEGLPPPSKDRQQNALRERMAFYSPIFQRMCRMAEATTGLTFLAFELEGKMMAYPRNWHDDADKKGVVLDGKVMASKRNEISDKFFTMLRMDLPPTRNPKRVFVVCKYADIAGRVGLDTQITD